MTDDRVPIEARSSSNGSPTTTLRGRWLVMLLAVLIVIDLLYFALGLASLPRYYQRVSTLTVEPYYELGE